MMLVLTVTNVGAFDCLILCDEAKRMLNVHIGDALYLYETSDGALRIIKANDDVTRQMALAGTVMREDSAILQVLAQ
jgi:hypothetical protein